MSSSLLHPPAQLPPSVALQLSQEAPTILANTSASIASFSIGSLFSDPESAEQWTIYENLMLSCLRTGDEPSARICLQKLTKRFGESNERVMALKGMLQEATAEDDAALLRVVKEYQGILTKDPTNMPIWKRLITVLKSLGKITEAINGLNSLLDVSPTDAEAWAELSDLYISQGLYQQAIFALEEVLLIMPNAWNIHAKLGEVLYIYAGAGNDANTEKTIAESLRRFCRCIELCDDYLRGYYGLKLTSGRLLTRGQTKKQSGSEDGELPIPDMKTIQLLNLKATAKLSEIVRRGTGGETGWRGYDEGELIAARELLDRDANLTIR